ncbi:MAG: leucine-rich repeat protein [Candidatus Nanoarchaeia archaeon]|nr:leucine-rich repeat protein [Candidatus Nanoarchaeia archaeon]
MNIDEIFPKKEGECLDSFVQEKYEKEHCKMNPAKDVILNGSKYSLNLDEYKILKKVAKKSKIRMSEIEDYEPKRAFTKYLGVEIENSRITKIHLNNCGLKSMKFLKHFKNLNSINLSNNEISKIDGLDGLKELKSLYLMNNNICEIAGLKNSHSLEELNLQSNKISKINELSCLMNLKILILSYNPLPSLDGLNGLKNLSALCLQGIKTVYENELLEKLCNEGTVVTL